MSVDDRLRSGMARNAVGFDPDVDSLLEATWVRRRRDRRVRLAGTVVGVVIAACVAAIVVSAGGWGRGDASEPLVPAGPLSSASPTRSAAGGGQLIPTGTWSREVTLAGISGRGLTLSPEEVTDNHLTDGSARLVLDTRPSSWSIFVENDAGRLVVGDTGTTTYDEAGRWVQRSDNTGGVTVLSWRVDGTALVTWGLNAAAPDGEHVFLEGTWLRED